MRIARVYDDPDPGEPDRVLVDRLWPRGLRKDDPRVGEWCPDVAPSTELRRWYGHRDERHEEFEQRYRAELDANLEALEHLRSFGDVTLTTATREVEISHVPVLLSVIEESP